MCVRTPFVSDLRQVGGFLRVFRFPPLIKTDLQVRDITEIWLKVAENTNNQTKQFNELPTTSDTTAAEIPGHTSIPGVLVI